MSVVGRACLPLRFLWAVDDGVSRTHAKVEYRAGRLWVTDLKSSNGTIQGAAQSQMSALMARALDVDISRRSAPATAEPPRLLGSRVAVFVCEAPLGKPFTPDYGSTSATAKAAARWLQAHKQAAAAIPPGFKVPAQSLGGECNLDSTRARDLALKVGASTVAWMWAADKEVKINGPDGKPRRAFATRLLGRAYRVDLGRYGRLNDSGAGPCDAPIIASQSCLKEYVAQGVDDMMAQWAESLRMSDSEF